MGQSSLNFNADGDDQDAEPGANTMPGSAEERDSSSIQSPNFQLAAESNPVGDAERSADATRTDASSGGNPSSDAQPNPSVQIRSIAGFAIRTHAATAERHDSR